MILSDLERLAKAATPGPWCKLGDYSVIQTAHVTRDVWNVCLADIADLRSRDIHKKDIEYIAAANPQTILTLLQVIRTYQAALEKCSEHNLDGDPWHDCPTIADKNAACNCHAKFAISALQSASVLLNETKEKE